MQTNWYSLHIKAMGEESGIKFKKDSEIKLWDQIKESEVKDTRVKYKNK